ncbi:MAG: hypothetical protein HC923_12750, partial [Myxococcales bacterium]|nr:hypothetical protein [Myxococcales bacterium]
MLGHELRNPLALIQSATDLVRLTCSGDERLERAGSVLARQSEHMAKLVDGLLEVARIERGKIDLEQRVIDLAGLCEQVLGDRRPVASARGLQLEGDLAPRPRMDPRGQGSPRA